MSGVDSFLRRSFRRRKKRKDVKVDKDSHKQSTTNFALAVAEAERLHSENRRLRQELEFERSSNRRQKNDFSFPPRSGLVSTGQQTDESDVVYSRNEIEKLESENRHLRRQIEDNEEQIKILKRLETEMITLQQQIASSQERNEDGVLKELREIRKDNAQLQKLLEELTKATSLKTSSGKQSWAADNVAGNKAIEQLKDLIIEYRNAMEKALADEMKRNSSPETKDNEIPDVPAMPPCVLAFAWKLQSCMVTMDKVKHFSRALGVGPDDVERLSKGNVSPREAFWSMLCHWNNTVKDKATLGHLQEACSKTGIKNSKMSIISLMPETDRLTLEKCHSFLVENLLPIVTLHYLRNKKLFDASDVYYVTSEDARPERCARLLALLPLFGEDAFSVFCEALIDSGQAHLAETLKGNTDTGSPEGDYGGTIGKHSGSSEVRLDDLGLHSTGFDMIVRILSTILAKCSHVEAMVMDRSFSDSDYSSLARSERERTL